MYTYESPIGPLFIYLRKGELAISFSKHVSDELPVDQLKVLIEDLDHYFESARGYDHVPSMAGTAFQLAVWQALIDIPAGQTRTYQALAIAIGRPQAARAVGMACHRNPLPILVPCHRVIGSNRTLTGYAGGLEKKQWLLDHEASSLLSQQSIPQHSL